MNKMLLLLLLASTVLFAQQEHFRADRMKNMAEMEAAMATIQKGFLFDNIHVVKNGVDNLKSAMTQIDTYAEASCSDSGFNSLTYVKNQAKYITKTADEILERFKNGDKFDASQGYLLVLDTCLECHKKIRSW